MNCEKRKVAAVVGALVADAAAQPLHWNYNIDKLNSILGDKKEIAFWEPSANPFYCIPTGSQSCYGDQSFVILKSLVDNDGLDIKNLQKSTYEFFGPKTTYDNSDNSGYEDKSDVKKKIFPIKASWRHFSIKVFLEKYEKRLEDTGCDKDEQMDCVLRIVPVVALYAGKPEMLDRAEEVIRITQNSDTSVAVGLAAARILEQYILYGNKPDILESIIEELSNPQRHNPQDLDKALAGQLREVLKCREMDHRTVSIPGAFQTTIHEVLTGNSYVDAVEETMRVGGCTCSRCGFIGACLAARDGIDSIPESWKQKTTNYPNIIDQAQKLVLEKS